MPPRALLIGASTGGPQALNTVLGHIAGVFDRVPVLITQHMPPTFTAILAEHLARTIDRPVREAVDGEPIAAGTIYIAPGGRHMRVARRDGAATIALDDGPPINFCKPAVDPLFASAAEVWGGKALALVLTGMGADGLRGAKAIVAAGGHVLAQDEASSVVWGMPGQVAHAGLASARAAAQRRSRRSSCACSGERRGDARRFRLSAQAPEGALRPGVGAGEAVSGRKPAAAAGAPARDETLAELVAALQGARRARAGQRGGRRDDHQRDLLLPRQGAVRAPARRRAAGADRRARARTAYSHLVRGGLHRPGALFDRDDVKEMGAALAGYRVEILATDLVGDLLERARAGIYSQFEVQRGLPIQMLVKYFTQAGESWQIAPELRGMVQFRTLNLLNDFSPLGRFDLVFCRNVLIYFDQPSKIKVLERIAQQMPDDGFLVLGAAETVVGLTEAFKPMQDHRGLYAPNAVRRHERPLASVTRLAARA